jgi:hypothetical protein
MEPWAQTLVTIVVACIASSGFWAFIGKKTEKKSANTKMLVGLGHDRIVELGMKYIERGYITQDEYENLHDYLYIPYEKLGGNGSAARIMKSVEKLPIHASTYTGEEKAE